MATFGLTDPNDTQSMMDAVNYAISNLGTGTSSGNANVSVTGNVLTGNATTGIISINQPYSLISYLYPYIAVRYADDAQGNGISTSPTNKQYFGVWNTQYSGGAPSPTDYTWTQATGGFGTTKFLYFITTGGGHIAFNVNTVAPDASYQQVQDGININLNFVTAAAQLLVVGAYIRSNTQPATPTGGTYDFGSYVLTPPVGWSATPPSGNDQLWVSQTTFATPTSGSTASPSVPWTTPYLSSSRGPIPLAFVSTPNNPITATQPQLTAWFSAPPTNSTAPIGTGLYPVYGDTASFTDSANAQLTQIYTFDTSNVWVSATGQVINGNLIATGTITASKLNVNDIYALNIESTNANLGNVSSPGFWLQANTGDAHFYGNVSIGNSLTVGTVIANSTLTANSVGATQIVGGSITTDKIAANTIQGNNIAANTIQGNNIVIGGITGTQIASGTITTNQIAANTITSNNIQIGGIDGTRITNNSISTQQISGNYIYGGNILGEQITGGTISGNVVYAGTVIANAIAANGITAGTLAANVIYSANIYGNQIWANTINGNSIQSNSITATKLAADFIYAQDIVGGNVTLGIYTGNGYWMQAATGAAYFGDSMLIDGVLNVRAQSLLAGDTTAYGNLTVGDVNAISPVDQPDFTVLSDIRQTGWTSTGGTFGGGSFYTQGSISAQGNIIIGQVVVPYGNSDPNAALMVNGTSNLLGAVNIQKAYIGTSPGADPTGYSSVYANSGINVFGYVAIQANGNSSNTGKPMNALSIVGNTAIQGNLNVSNVTVSGSFNTNNLSLSGTITANAVSVSGNIYSSNVITGNIAVDKITATGTVTAAQINLQGNLSAQNISTPGIIIGSNNITTLGFVSTVGNIRSQSTISASGNIISAANIIAVGDVTATGNISGTYITGNGAFITGVTANAVGILAGAMTGNILANSYSILNLPQLSVAGIVQTATNITGGNIIATTLINSANISASGTITTAGLIVNNNATVVGNIVAGIHQGTTISITGNATASNISAVGNIRTGNIISVNAVTGQDITAFGNVYGVGNVLSSNLKSNGNVYGTQRTPVTGSSGTLGQIAWDNNYIYVYTSTGWKRAALTAY